MTTLDKLNDQINRAGFGAAIITLTTGVISVFLPLDVPNGYEATLAERVAWLTGHSGLFMIGWINQIAAMVSISGILGAIAWQIAHTHPLRALLAASLVAFSMVAFFIPKFIAVWTIPMLAEAIATGSVARDMAEGLLPILNVTVPFSLYASFDYLGFWLYSLFALLVAIPLTRCSLSAKIIGITLGAFGVLYNVIVVAILMGAIRGPEIEAYIMGVALLLLIVCIPALFLFRSSRSLDGESSA